ncbi:MAG: hypothetical protein VKM92_00810 [Cyanobacteriota bacterium]|nr:hypothetical protein [Cyanobacteriota bacterium]
MPGLAPPAALLLNDRALCPSFGATAEGRGNTSCCPTSCRSSCSPCSRRVHTHCTEAAGHPHGATRCEHRGRRSSCRCSHRRNGGHRLDRVVLPVCCCTMGRENNAITTAELFAVCH